MENITEQLTKYINSQLTFAAIYPDNAKMFMYTAFGALELACLVVDEDTKCRLENWWESEIVNRFRQNYR